MNDEKSTIRVVIRTRPTPHFASKQIILDSTDNVN
jgi:hypothetical protein